MAIEWTVPGVVGGVMAFGGMTGIGKLNSKVVSIEVTGVGIGVAVGVVVVGESGALGGPAELPSPDLNHFGRLT